MDKVDRQNFSVDQFEWITFSGDTDRKRKHWQEDVCHCSQQTFEVRHNITSIQQKSLSQIQVFNE